MQASHLLCAFGLCALSSITAAQEPAPAAASAPGAAAPRVAKVRALSLRPGDEAYPATLHAKGVQGVVEVLALIGADGSPVEVSVASTSRSQDLDEAGLALVRTLKFGVAPAGNAASAASATPGLKVLVPVEFQRDSVATLGKKTCREFSVDAAYFRATFPEKSVSDMPALRMTTGVLVMAAPQRAAADVIAMSKKTASANAAIVEACTAAPDSAFLSVYRDLVAKVAG
jgi:protein TonB